MSTQSPLTPDRLERLRRLANLGELHVGVARDFCVVLDAIAEQVRRVRLHSDINAVQHELEHIADAIEVGRTMAAQYTSDLATPPPRQWARLSHVVQRALPLLHAAAEGPARIRLSIDARAPLVQIHGATVQRVLLALVRNAARAVKTPHGVIEIGVVGMRDFVRLTVADNGAGMDNATLERVLRSLAHPESSYGEGLRGVAAAVRDLGGRLHLESQQDIGTTVRIDLPSGATPLREHDPVFAPARQS